MEKIDLKALGAPLVERIAKEWMLVTAGTADEWNTMTASWGGVGWLWNRPVAFVFVRPERYTHEFIERHEHLTLSFLSPDERDVLSFCGLQNGFRTLFGVFCIYYAVKHIAYCTFGARWTAVEFICGGA